MTTLCDTLRQFADYGASLNLSAETVLTRNKGLLLFRRWLEARYGVTTPSQLRKDHLQAYQAHLARHRTVKGCALKPGTINNRVKALRAWLDFLTGRGLAPSALKSGIAYVKEPKRLPTGVLEHAEIRQRLRRIDTTSAPGYRDRTILELLYTTGLRRGELLGLNLDDVDLGNATVRVMGKGRKERVVPVGRTALRHLQGYIKAIRPFWRGQERHARLFLTKYGEPLGKDGLVWMIDHHFRGASVRVTPHTFRRSCTTELVRGNANLYHVKELLGHESLVSLSPYAKLTIADLRKTHARCHPRERDELAERGG